VNPLDAARDRLLARFEAVERAAAGEPAWLAAQRRAAIAAFAERGLPSTRLEEWRYTNVAPLARIPFEPADAPVRVEREAVEALAIPVFACTLFVFVDGRYRPELSTPPLLAGDVAVESLARLRSEEPGRLEPWLGSLLEPKQHPFAALNTAFLDDGAVLIVPEGRQLDRPLHVVFVGSAGGAPTLQHPRVLVVAGAGSRATLIQDHVSLSAAAGFTNAVTEIEVGAGARVDYVHLQRERGERYHVSNLQIRQQRDSRFFSHVLTMGGRLVRNDLEALLADEGADCELDGLFLADGEDLVDNHTRVDHAVPRGTSRQLYKGILAGRARGVFRGRVIVRPDAQGTDARQSNPNLLLADGAEIDTRPQLEIHADDVRCSHGSSIGQVDPDALFYLRARGLREAEARDLLARGFACEVTARLPLESLRQEIDQLVLDALARARGESQAGDGT
jgi:Fe-S cluster assembly protein SufD